MPPINIDISILQRLQHEDKDKIFKLKYFFHF